MLDQVLDVFNVVPEYDLSIMKDNQTIFDVTAEVISKIHTILESERPDLLLVHGDTTTTFASALAAFYLQIPVGHVEAGLRTFNIYSPFPEEFNRQAVGIIANLHFAPTKIAKMNLLNAGVPESKVFVTGNTAIDALKTTISNDYSHELFSWIGDNRLITITAHRRENLGKPMHEMFRAIRRILDEYDDVRAIYPVHMNPVVRKAAIEELGECKSIKLIDPLDVLDFHNFMKKSYLIITDSGGIQEEAPSLGVPVLVMRDTTERPEGISAGTLKLVGTNENGIYNNLKLYLDDMDEYSKMSKSSNPYGDGTASIQIADIIEKTFFGLN